MTATTAMPRSSQPPPAKRRRTPNTTYYTTYVVTIPIATGLLCGSRDNAVELFHKTTLREMDKLMAASTMFHRIPHYQRHDTGIIGSAQSSGTGYHPWGYLTFGIVSPLNELKECVISCIHHRETVSPNDALLNEAKTVPWHEIKEFDP